MKAFILRLLIEGCYLRADRFNRKARKLARESNRLCKDLQRLSDKIYKYTADGKFLKAPESTDKPKK